MAVALTKGTALAPQRYERYLLALYQRGLLTIDEVVDLLDLSIYQVLYHSHVTAAPKEADLQHLLDQSRRYNVTHQITGLLLYSDGRYVQVLEGAEADVRALYARIQRDARHERLVTVSAGPGSQRHFADWRMGFGHVAGSAVKQVLDALQASTPRDGLQVDDPHLRALLDAFGTHPLAAEVVPVVPQ